MNDRFRRQVLRAGVDAFALHSREEAVQVEQHGIALFGDGSYSFNDKLTFNGGLRATR